MKNCLLMKILKYLKKIFENNYQIQHTIYKSGMQQLFSVKSWHNNI